GEEVGVLGFDVGGARGGIIGAGHGEERLAGLHEFTGGDEDLVDRPANGGENGSGGEGVVGDRAGEAESARERRFFRGHDLNVRHLLFGNGEKLGGVRLGFRGGEGSHLRFGFAGAGAATREREEEEGEGERENPREEGAGRLIVRTHPLQKAQRMGHPQVPLYGCLNRGKPKRKAAGLPPANGGRDEDSPCATGLFGTTGHSSTVMFHWRFLVPTAWRICSRASM